MIIIRIGPNWMNFIKMYTSLRILFAILSEINLRPAVAFSVIWDKWSSSLGMTRIALSNNGLIDSDAFLKN